LVKTLVVDGNSLLNTGFHGIKNMYNGDKHIGGLYHFLNTLRKLIDTYLITKVVVFWDGKNNTSPRTKIYPEYKLNRKAKLKDSEQLDSYAYQKLRVQEYLEELYVRQSSFDLCEADDCMAYYCEKSQKEEIIVLTSDRDLLQLISPSVSVHVISLNKLFKFGEKVPLNGVNIPSALPIVTPVPTFIISLSPSRVKVPTPKVPTPATFKLPPTNKSPKVVVKPVNVETPAFTTSPF